MDPTVQNRVQNVPKEMVNHGAMAIVRGILVRQHVQKKVYLGC